jgi:hypothetical protein
VELELNLRNSGKSDSAASPSQPSDKLLPNEKRQTELENVKFTQVLHPKAAVTQFLEDLFSQAFARDFLHYGGFGLQSLTAAFLGIAIICRAGGFLNFLAGVVWMASRILITIVWLPLMYLILAGPGTSVSVEGVWRRYAVYLLVNICIQKVALCTEWAFLLFLYIRGYN